MSINFSKKVIRIMALVLLMSLFVGCETNSSNKVLSSSKMPDFQYMFKAMGVRKPTQKSNSGYYNVVNNRIIYTDSSTLKSTPLCNKSDCLHTSDFVDCNAKVDDWLNCFDNFQIYRDKIYYLSVDVSEKEEVYHLNSISLDGAEKSTVLTLKNKFVTDWFLYNNYFYYQSSAMVDDSSKNFYKVDLSTRDEEIFIDFSKLNGIYGAEGSLRNIYDGYMYITLYGYTNENDYEKVINGEEIDGNVSTVRKIVRYNLADKSSMLIDPYDNDYEFIGFSDGQLIGTDTEGDLKKVCVSNLDGSDVKTIIETENVFQVFCDENYIYIYNQSVVQSSNERKSIFVYDKNGEKISEAYVPDLIAESLNAITFYDDYIWFQNYLNSGEISLCAIEKTDLLNNGKEFNYNEVYISE